MGKKRAPSTSDQLEAAKAAKKVKEEPDAKENGETEKPKQDPQVKKDELKEELKEEIKEEEKDKSEDALADVKEENNEEEELDAILGDVPEVEDKRGLKQKQREEAALQVQPVETETEYDEPDLSTFPEKIVIEACSYEKLDGMYRIMPKPSRGRPAYFKAGSKSSYLYWHPGKRWQIGFDFGAKKCAASIQDLGPLGPPLEPYPFIWKAIEKSTEKDKDKEKSKEKVTSMQMRAFDERFREEADEFLGEEMFQPVEFAQKSRYEAMDPDYDGGDEMAEEPENESVGSSQPSKPSPPSKSSAPSKQSSRPSSQRRTARSSPKKPSLAKVPGNLADDEEAAVVMNALHQSDSDDESRATAKATSSQPSDSGGDTSGSSDESSSSESLSEEESSDPEYEALGAKAQSIVRKLKGMPKEQAANKFKMLFDVLRQRSKNGTVTPWNGCSQSDMKHLAQWSTRHLDVPDLWSSLTQPAVPRTPEEPQPHTPPVDQEAHKNADMAAQLPHHTMVPAKSVLRKPGQRAERARRIQHHEEIHEVMVASYKAYGEGLWFQAPGALVNCEHCNRLVPQAMGHLQGAAGRSQFAQNQFLCQDCVPRS